MLTKTDLDNIDKGTKKIVKENNFEIYKKMAQAFSENNFKLFEKLASKLELKENYVSKEQLQVSISTLQNTMDKMYGLLKKHDQEQTAMSHQVNNHENRLTKVEAILA
jgi:exonuclease VII large subunit